MTRDAGQLHQCKARIYLYNGTEDIENVSCAPKVDTSSLQYPTLCRNECRALVLIRYIRPWDRSLG